MPATTALPAPSTAETVRTAVVRADSAVLATDGAAPVTTVLHHLHSDGDLFVVVPDDCAAVALTWQRGAAGLHAVLELTDPQVSKELRLNLRKTTCARFATVLGPGSDGYHESHVHVDLAQRTGGHRMCQWEVRDPEEEAAANAVPLPMPRPASAGP